MKDHLIGWIVISVIVGILCSAANTKNDADLFPCVFTIIIGAIIGFIYSSFVSDYHEEQHKVKYYY